MQCGCISGFGLIEEMVLERGILVSYETIRRWSPKFGKAFAPSLDL